MNTDYEKGYRQFAEVVGEDNIESVLSHRPNHFRY